jgi:serine/threonine protein kinase
LALGIGVGVGGGCCLIGLIVFLVVCIARKRRRQPAPASIEAPQRESAFAAAVGPPKPPRGGDTEMASAASMRGDTDGESDVVVGSEYGVSPLSEKSSEYSDVPATALVPALGALNRNASGGALQSACLIPLEHLRIGDKCGEGQHGIVWHATLHGLDVAVKQVKLGESGGTKAIADFGAELAKMAQLPSHANIVRFYGVTTLDSGELAAVVEFCGGGSLVAALYGEAARAWTVPSQLRVAGEAAAGVVFLHGVGIVHRDIAARNVLLTTSGAVKLGDFGMSRTIVEQDKFQQYTVDMLTPVRWCSPETISKRAYSRHSDVYSFGVLLYEIFAREMPWRQLTAVEAGMAVMRGERLAAPRDAPRGIATLIAQCTQHEAKARPNMQEVQASIERCKIAE